jgi:uncharacterized protein (TIGR02646 family)
MMKITKSAAPSFWNSKYKVWGRTYKAKRTNPLKKSDFAWATHLKQKVNLTILPLLKGETQSHCSFCDGFPLDCLGETIEHFRAKSVYPLLSYYWTNLFYCCNKCNEHKAESPERKLLKPDSAGYRFEDYFYVDYLTGRIEVNYGLSKSDRARAANTVELYGLNEYNRPNRRRMYARMYADSANPNIDEFPYRFMY